MVEGNDFVHTNPCFKTFKILSRFWVKRSICQKPNANQPAKRFKSNKLQIDRFCIGTPVFLPSHGHGNKKGKLKMFLFLRREGWKTFLPMILISFDVEWLLTDLAPRPELLIIIWMRLPTSIFQKSGSRSTSFYRFS